MYYPNQMVNPYMSNLNNSYDPNRFQYANTLQQPSTLTRVTGMEGAKAFQMNPNSVAALFDANEDLMYIKSTDGAGFPTIRTFTFTEYKPQEETPTINPDYITRQEFDKFREEISEYGKQFIQKSNKQNKSTNAE